MRTSLLATSVLALTLTLAPALASAQTVTIKTTQFRRANLDNDVDPPDPGLGDPRRKDPTGAFGGINLDECTRGELWHLEATTEGLSGTTLFVYTGVSCDLKTSRDDQAEDCKEMDRVSIDTDSTQEHEWDLPANEIANIEDATCDDLDDNLRVWLVVLEAAGDDTAVASAPFPTEGDIRVLTTLPEAPSNVRSGPGENRADIDWDGASQGQEYFVACSPLPGAQGLAPSGEPTFDAAGQETCAGEAPTSGFAEGATLDRSWRCDQGDGETIFAQGISAESATIEGLQNEVQYHFAVVAVDEVGNPSLLSEVSCSTPKPVDDFFELYRRAGGAAGGGVCAAAPGRPAGTGWIALCLVGTAGLGLARRRRRRGRLGVAGVAAVLAVLTGSGVASADGLRYLQDDYRSPQNFALEIRGGPYYPDVDDEFDGSATPFQDSFDDHSRLRIGFEVDWQALRTPVASLGVGLSGSLMRYVGTARFEGSGEASSEETTLIVLPIVALAVVRFDFAIREWQVPLAPYVKLGFGTYLWFAEDGDGTARADGADGEADAVLGSGRTHGLELSGGVAFLLDFLEPQAARKLDADGGVNHSYLFAEILWATMDGFGANGVMNLGDTTWNLGLLLEM
jgi:hypothetical protein